MQNLHVVTCIYHLNLLRIILSLLHRNSDVVILLEVVCIGVKRRHNSYLWLLQLSLLHHRGLKQLLRVVLNNGLSSVHGLIWWDLALVDLTTVDCFRSEVLLINSWLIQHEVLVLHGLWTNHLLILEVATLIKCRLLIDRFIEPVVQTLVSDNLSVLR
jgi:hypothetical protein